jgi:hypothetical protein
MRPYSVISTRPDVELEPPLARPALRQKACRRNAVPEQQLVEYRGSATNGADDAWVPSEASTDENSEGWRHTAARVIDGVVRSSDWLVDITDTGGKVSRSVPLWEAICLPQGCGRWR